MLATDTTTTGLLEGLFDPAADDVWREFDGRYRPIIAGFARRVGMSEQDAADAAQETLTRFVRSYQAGKYDRGRGRLRSWLIGIARHVVADACASRAGRRQWRGSSAIVDLPDDDELSAVWESERRAAIIARALDELRQCSRTSEQSLRAFEMVAFEQRSPTDVAAALNMTRHDVYVAKHRISQRLRESAARLEQLYDAEE